jgi:CBS domain-containing protein
VERTSAHITWDVVYAGPDWTLEAAAEAMARGGFRHLVVLDGDEVLGVISVRDIMRVWARERTEAAA